MLETGTSGLMSGEGKQPAASRSRSSALPRLYAVLGDGVPGLSFDPHSMRPHKWTQS